MKSIFMVFLSGVALAGCSAAVDDGSGGSQAENQPIANQPAAPSGETAKDCISRGDHVASITISDGNWGSWASCFDMCPPGSYAYGVNLKSEAPVGSSDDTSVNAVSLWCYNRGSGAFTEFVESTQQGWGTWLDASYCAGGSDNPIVSGNLRLEAPQGSGADDTSANGLRFSCKNSSGVEETAVSNTGWGTFRGKVQCPAGTAVCGVKTRVEANQGSGDDTALNGLQYACCTF
jgi:hypothetical protein